MGELQEHVYTDEEVNQQKNKTLKPNASESYQPNHILNGVYNDDLQAAEDELESFLEEEKSVKNVQGLITALKDHKEYTSSTGELLKKIHQLLSVEKKEEIKEILRVLMPLSRKKMDAVTNINSNSSTGDIALMQFFLSWAFPSVGYTGGVTGVWNEQLAQMLNFCTRKNNNKKTIEFDSTGAECAGYVINQIGSILIHNKLGTREDAKNLFASGDAWTMYQSILDRGGKKIFSVFPDKFSKEDLQTIGERQSDLVRDIRGSMPSIVQSVYKKLFQTNDTIMRGVQDRTEKKGRENISKCPKNLKVGDVVGLYYPQSSNYQLAYDGTNSATINTHVGIVKYSTQLGEPVISHSVHGVVINTPLSHYLNYTFNNNDLFDCAIARVARPDYCKVKQMPDVSDDIFGTSQNDQEIKEVEFPENEY